MKISDKHLNILIEGLTQYKKEGIWDPWVLEDGTTIEPLDVLVELKEFRELEKYDD